MAKKITELTELTNYATNDLLIIEDVSAGVTKKITWANLVADNSITSAKLVQAFMKGRYQANTTNSDQSGITMQFGWGWIPGDGTNAVSETVTFPTAYTTTLGVFPSALGFLSGSNPTALADFNAGFGGNIIMPHAYSITATNFVIKLTEDSAATFTSTLRIGYSWIALGIV